MKRRRSLRSGIAARVFGLALLCIAACGRTPKTTLPTVASNQTLRVLAAASLADAFREVGAAFEAANPGAKVEFSFGGSNQLRTQLEHGAPGDVFASADRKQMEAATTSKAVDSVTVRVFAHNRLAIVVPKENRAGVKGLADLTRSGLKIVVADKTVPVGNYTRQMLDKAGQAATFGPNFVKGFDANTVSREENVAAVVAKVALNEADAGIAYASDAAGGNAEKITVIPLPSELEQKADYVVAVTTRATDSKLAANFIEFLRSSGTTSILTKRGFTMPDAGKP